MGLSEFHQPIVFGENEILQEGQDVLLLSTGSMVQVAYEAAQLLTSRGVNPTVVNIRFLQDADEELLKECATDHSLVVMAEEVVSSGSYGEKLAASIAKAGLSYRFLHLSLPDIYVEQGNVNELRQRYGLTAEAVCERILDTLKGMKQE